MKEIAFRRKGEIEKAIVRAAYRFENGDYVPLVLESIPVQMPCAVVVCVAKRLSRARERAKAFITEHPDFRGAVLYDDDGTYSFEPCGVLLVVGRPDIGKLDEAAIARNSQIQENLRDPKTEELAQKVLVRHRRLCQRGMKLVWHTLPEAQRCFRELGILPCDEMSLVINLNQASYGIEHVRRCVAALKDNERSLVECYLAIELV